MIQAAEILSRDVGKKPACEAFNVSRATYYRHLNPGKPETRRPRPPLALSSSERQVVLDALHIVAPRPWISCLIPDLRQCQRTTQAGSAAALRKARTVGHNAEPGVVMGYNQTQRSGQMDLLLPVRNHGYLQPLHRRLDGRPSRTKGAGQTPDRTKLPETAD